MYIYKHVLYEYFSRTEKDKTFIFYKILVFFCISSFSNIYDLQDNKFSIYLHVKFKKLTFNYYILQIFKNQSPVAY